MAKVLFIFIVLLILVLIQCWITFGKSRYRRVIEGSIVNGGIYIFQNEKNKKAILSVSGENETIEAIAGNPLMMVNTSSWVNGEYQKWNIKQWGKTFIKYFITPIERVENEFTYRIYTDNFKQKNIFEILDDGDLRKVWLIKMYRGNCLSYHRLNTRIQYEKCDIEDPRQQWHLHLLNQ